MVSKKMGKIRITQSRSKIGRPENQKRTLVALGLDKINKTVELEAKFKAQLAKGYPKNYKRSTGSVGVPEVQEQTNLDDLPF